MLNILSHKKNNHKRFFSPPFTVVLLRLLFTPVSITPLIDTEDACFDLNASRPIAKGDLKWRDALLVAHRVSSNDFTEDSRRSVLHERERGYAYADRS